MPTPAVDSESMIPLTPAVFHILLALSSGPLHGYAIMQSVAETTGGRMEMGPGTLYGTVKRLLESGLISESEDRPKAALDDERRRYYQLTTLGERVLAAETRRLDQMVRMARRKGIRPGSVTA